jgi:hypothetical protein
MVTRAAITASLALVLAGCPPPRVSLPKEGDTASTVLARLEAAEAKVSRVRGEAKLKAEGKEGRTVVTLFIAAEAPAKVHLEQLDFFGKPQAVLVTDGVHFTLFDGQKGKWYRGPATAHTLSRFFPVTLTPPELAGLLMGKALRVSPPEVLSLDIDQKQYKLVASAGSYRDVLWVSPESGRVERSERTGAPEVSCDFGEWTQTGGAALPRRTQLQRGDGSLSLELAWKEVELNGPADPSLFELALPEGVQAIELDGRGEETSLKPGAVVP